jgi:hypothetical protein
MMTKKIEIMMMIEIIALSRLGYSTVPHGLRYYSIGLAALLLYHTVGGAHCTECRGRDLGNS